MGTAPKNNKARTERLGASTVNKASILVTGGAGFIGSCFVRFVLERTDFSGRIVNFDKLTYAGNISNLSDIDRKHNGKRYFFERGDICDLDRVREVLKRYDISIVVHFAAESHVDRSILGPQEFIHTNINGTFALLEVCRSFWEGREDIRFHHISTDEVYGSLGETGHFFETTPYDPRSPYSASKAASDHLVRAYFHTYGLPVTITNCSNNYGPYQFPEKLIPLMVLSALEGQPLPLYGDGRNVRDWLYVEDHCDAVWKVLSDGTAGETYNIGGECERQNREIVERVCGILEEARPSKENAALKGRTYQDLITYVADRPGHDRRYAINCDKIKQELGWKQEHTFEQGLRKTVSWYLEHAEWVQNIRSGEYTRWIEKNYSAREHR
ncbi:MAG TPA: dTDP-glucose 4,6-dehydratase [Nitrospirota bacterium]|nr:dTDP-glucose 4,6-dehydratase [Nitrospirota bacterium]